MQTGLNATQVSSIEYRTQFRCRTVSHKLWYRPGSSADLIDHDDFLRAVELAVDVVQAVAVENGLGCSATEPDDRGVEKLLEATAQQRLDHRQVICNYVQRQIMQS